MRRNIVTLLAVGLITPLASAGIIFDNGEPNLTNAGFSDAGRGNGTLAADDFLLEAGTNVITDIHWWGVYQGPNNVRTTDDAFRITIHADDAGTPGDVVESIAAGNDAMVMDTGQSGTVDLLDIYEYWLYVDPIVLDPNETYWLAILNDPEAEDHWAWSFSADAGNALVDAGIDGSWTGFDSELAFRLTNDDIIPEPASLTLLGLGVAGLAIRRRLKR